MAYQDESDRIRRQMEQGERDLVFAEKQAAIAACYGLPTEGVMDVIRGRSKGVTLTGIDSADDYFRNPTKAVWRVQLEWRSWMRLYGLRASLRRASGWSKTGQLDDGDRYGSCLSV